MELGYGALQGPERTPPVDEEQLRGHILEGQSPVYGRIATAHQEHPLPPVFLRIGNGEVHPLPEELLIAGTLQPDGLEGPLSSGQEKRPCEVVALPPSEDDEVTIPFEIQDLFVQDHLGIELESLRDEVSCPDHGPGFWGSPPHHRCTSQGRGP